MRGGGEIERGKEESSGGQKRRVREKGVGFLFRFLPSLHNTHSKHRTHGFMHRRRKIVGKARKCIVTIKIPPVQDEGLATTSSRHLPLALPFQSSCHLPFSHAPFPREKGWWVGGGGEIYIAENRNSIIFLSPVTNRKKKKNKSMKKNPQTVFAQSKFIHFERERLGGGGSKRENPGRNPREGGGGRRRKEQLNEDRVAVVVVVR